MRRKLRRRRSARGGCAERCHEYFRRGDPGCM